MAGPGTIFSGTTAPTRKERPGPDKWITRLLIYAAIGLFIPIAALFTGIYMLLFQYARMPWWVPAPIAAVVFFLITVFGGIGDHFTGHLTMWGNVIASITSDEGVAAWWRENWWGFVAEQFLLGFFIGSVWATGAAGWKWIRRPKWEHRMLRPGPVLQRRLKKTVEDIASGRHTPKDGVTVGASLDLRDPRFAAGAPGTPYGERVVLTDQEGAGHTLVVGGSGSGKALDVDTPIATPTGFVRMGELRTGDVVFGRDGTETTVVGAFDTMLDHACFDVTFSTGESITADMEHLWAVGLHHVDAPVEHAVLTTRDVLARLHDGVAVTVTLPAPVMFPHRDLPASPVDIAAAVLRQDSSAEPLAASLVTASLAQRMEFFHAVRHASRFGSRVNTGAYTSPMMPHRLARYVWQVLCSLGFHAETRVYTDDASAVVWREDTAVMAVESVRLRPSRPVRCIAVDADDHLFLAGHGFVPTHNTTTMLTGMRDVIQRGHGLIVVDCKGGPDVPRVIADWAATYGRDFYHWEMFDPRAGYDGPADSPAFYNPIGRGDPSRRKDLIIGSQANAWQGAAEYYKSVIGDYLQTVFTVIDLVPPPEGVDTFKDVSEMLSPSALIARASSIPKERYPDLAAALQHISELGDREKSAISNMYARLNTLTSSIAGAWLRYDPAGERDIDLIAAADRGAVVVFSLDSSNYEETTSLLAGLIVQDLKTASSTLREQPSATPTHVYIDEFSAVDATNVYGLLAKARDARMPVTLATQALADLRRREEHFDAQVLGIVSSFLIHRANSEDDARVFAGLAGLHRRMTHRAATEGTTGTMGTLGAAAATGSGFLQEEEDYRVEPGAFQRLAQGQCVFIAKMPTDRYVNPVQVVMEDHRAEMLHDAPAQPHYTTRPPERYEVRETYPYPGGAARVASSTGGAWVPVEPVAVDLPPVDVLDDDVDSGWALPTAPTAPAVPVASAPPLSTPVDTPPAANPIPTAARPAGAAVPTVAPPAPPTRQPKPTPHERAAASPAAPAPSGPSRPTRPVATPMTNDDEPDDWTTV